MSFRLLLLLSLTAFLLLSDLPGYRSDTTADDDEEDLSFLEEPDESTPQSPFGGADHNFGEEEEEDFEDDAEDDQSLSDFDESESDPIKELQIDEKDVVLLKERNFSDVIENNKFVLVEFYAPWCGHCQALAPEYAAAATELKAEGVVLAKIDATVDHELAHEYDVQGFPTLYFFIDGERKAYTGGRSKDAIVTWVKKKTGPGVYNITTLDEAERILTSEDKVVLGYLNSLVGSESEQLVAVSKGEDDVNFYQTVNSDVAKLFHIDPKVKRPALVLLKKEAEKINHFDGEFAKSAIAEFVTANKLPLVTTFTRESAPAIFDSPIKNQLLLFSTKNDSEKVFSVYQEVAKNFKGKLIFVYVDLDNEDYGRPVADYFGVSGDGPQIIAYTGNDDPRKYLLDGELKVDRIKAFGEDFLNNKLKPFYKSDPIPEKNDGDVKIVVGNNFDEIVLDESKDVLLEVYATWCGHCQALEPTYNKLAKHLRDVKSLVIAKMDGTTNEHPKAKAEGFPTILFYPAGNKTSDPLPVDVDRTVVALYKFIKKHASIPFKLPKPAPSVQKTDDDASPRQDVSDAKKPDKSITTDKKDEL